MLRMARTTLCLALALTAATARADLPDAATLLGALGLDPEAIAQVQSGQFVRIALKPASDRELVAGLAFMVSTAPDALVAELRRHLLDRASPGITSFGVIQIPATLAGFQALVLEPDAAARARAYVTAGPGEALNLSSGEIAEFAALGTGAPVASVEQALRTALLARLQAYRSQGLAGIAPYARDGGQRSPADELRTATAASVALEKYAPAAYRALAEYPEATPPGTEEAFQWTQFQAHDVPTIALTHMMLVPDGAAWIALQREYYVSSGYNVEQAIAAFLPTQSGTIVVYANRTSTDQISGFGGDAKRSIGSRVLESQLESMFERARSEPK